MAGDTDDDGRYQTFSETERDMDVMTEDIDTGAASVSETSALDSSALDSSALYSSALDSTVDFVDQN